MEVINIPDLPESTNPSKLVTLGVDSANNGFKIPVERIGRSYTGADTSSGVYWSTASALNFVPGTAGKGRTFVCLFTLPDELPTVYSSPIVFSRYTYLGSDSNELYAGLKYSELVIHAGKHALSLAEYKISVAPRQLCMIVLRIAEDGTVTGFFNGTALNGGIEKHAEFTEATNQLCLGRWEPEDPNTDAPKPHFEGTIHAYAEYAGLLTDDESVALWNFGRPDAASLRVTATEATAVMRYLPADLTAEVWADSSGNGYDLAAYDEPKPVYTPLPDGREAMIDTGIFYTNIAAGTAQKQIGIPQGYVPVLVALFVYGSTGLSGVNVGLSSGTAGFISNGQVPPRLAAYATSPTMASGSYYPGGGIVSMNQQYYLNVTASGNSSAGGMRVRVFCRWVGY